MLHRVHLAPPFGKGVTSEWVRTQGKQLYSKMTHGKPHCWFCLCICSCIPLRRTTVHMGYWPRKRWRPQVHGLGDGNVHTNALDFAVANAGRAVLQGTFPHEGSGGLRVLFDGKRLDSYQRMEASAALYRSNWGSRNGEEATERANGLVRTVFRRPLLFHGVYVSGEYVQRMTKGGHYGVPSLNLRFHREKGTLRRGHDMVHVRKRAVEDSIGKLSYRGQRDVWKTRLDVFLVWLAVRIPLGEENRFSYPFWGLGAIYCWQKWRAKRRVDRKSLGLYLRFLHDTSWSLQVPKRAQYGCVLVSIITWTTTITWG